MLEVVAHIGHVIHAVGARGITGIYVAPSGGGDPVFDEVVLTLGLIAAVPFLFVRAQNVHRWTALRNQGSTSMPSVVKGSGVGLHSEPMPGTLFVREGRLWWVAEGSTEPVSLAGKHAAGPRKPVGVPRELSWGAMDDPQTIAIKLAAGGSAELTVRGPSAEEVKDLVKHPPAGLAPRVPSLRGHAPLSRLALTALGVIALLLAGGYTTLANSAPRAEATVVESSVQDGVDLVEWTQDGTAHTDTVDSDGLPVGASSEVIVLPLVDQVVSPESAAGSAAMLLLVGLGALGAGFVQLAIRRDRVRTSRASLNLTLPAEPKDNKRKNPGHQRRHPTPRPTHDAAPPRLDPRVPGMAPRQ